MDSSRRVVGVAVADERPLAGSLVGWMFIVGAIVTTLLPLLPGADGEVLTPTLPIGVAAFVWGVLAVTKVRLAHRAGLGHPRLDRARRRSRSRSRPTTPAAPTRPRGC